MTHERENARRARPGITITSRSRTGAKLVVALQLYTVRGDVEADYPGTLKKVAAMGYKAVQGGPNAKHDAKSVRAMIDDLGLVSAGNHIGIEMLEKEFNVATIVEHDATAGALGEKWMGLGVSAEAEEII